MRHRHQLCPGLPGIRPGSTVRVTGIDLPASARLRLAELGVRPGVVITVLGRTAGGGQLLGIGTARLALDGGTAGRVAVEQAA